MRAHGLLLALLVVLLAVAATIFLGARANEQPGAVFGVDPVAEAGVVAADKLEQVTLPQVDLRPSGGEQAPLVEDARLLARSIAGDSDRGSVHVHVLDIDTRRPIAGALVQTKIGTEYACEFTDDEGAVVLHGVAADHAHVWIDWRGAPLRFARIPELCVDGAPAIASPSSAYADLRHMDPPWRFELLLAARSRVTGRATLDERPLVGHELSVAPVMDEDASLPRCTTDEAGRFELEEVTSGSVRFHIESSPDDDRASRVHAPLADLEVQIRGTGEQEVELAWVSTGLTRVRGRVVDEAGAALAGVMVLLERNESGGVFEGPRLTAIIEERWSSVLARPTPRFLPLSEVIAGGRVAQGIAPPSVVRSAGHLPNPRYRWAATGPDGCFEFQAMKASIYRLIVGDAFSDEERRDRLITDQPWFIAEWTASGLVDTRVESDWDVGDVPTQQRVFVIIEGTVSVRGADDEALLPGFYVVAGCVRTAGLEPNPSASLDATRCDVLRSSKTYEWFGVVQGDTAYLDLWGPKSKGRDKKKVEVIDRRELKIEGLEWRHDAWYGRVDWVVDPPP